MSGFYGDNRDVDKIYTQALENAKHSSSLDYLPAVLAQVTRLKHGKKKERGEKPLVTRTADQQWNEAMHKSTRAGNRNCVYVYLPKYPEEYTQKHRDTH